MKPTTETYEEDGTTFLKLTYEPEDDEEEESDNEYVFLLNGDNNALLHSVRSGTGWGIVYMEDVYRAMDDLRENSEYNPSFDGGL